MNTVILHSNDIVVAEKLTAELKGELESRQSHFRINTKLFPDLEQLRDLYRVDINLLSETFNYSKAALLVCDMDSTLITIESIDEIAKIVGLANKVASITEKAMQGKLDFTSSFKARVLMLKGTKSEVIEQVYNEQLRLSKGAEEMINFFKTINVKTAVISGGLSYFARRIQDRLVLDNYRANNVEIVDGCLTGNVTGEVIDATEKARYIHELCAQYGFQENQVIAIGDGANDLEMMKIAGLSVAYHAKPLLQENCDVVIKYGGLDTIIDFFTE